MHHYYFGDGKDLEISINQVDVRSIKRSDIMIDREGNPILNFLNIKGTDWGTQVGLGSMNLLEVGEDEYEFLPNKFDFDMHDWNAEWERNILTFGLDITLDLVAFAGNISAFSPAIVGIGRFAKPKTFTVIIKGRFKIKR